jgi:hypothetical protein
MVDSFVFHVDWTTVVIDRLVGVSYRRDCLRTTGPQLIRYARPRFPPPFGGALIFTRFL